MVHSVVRIKIIIATPELWWIYLEIDVGGRQVVLGGAASHPLLQEEDAQLQVEVLLLHLLVRVLVGVAIS